MGETIHRILCGALGLALVVRGLGRLGAFLQYHMPDSRGSWSCGRHSNACVELTTPPADHP